MHTTLGPSPHREVEKITKPDWLSLAKHVVMFVHMEDELRCDKRPLVESLFPVFKGFMVVVHNLIHWTVRPIKQFVEPVQGIVKETKVVQVYVEDGCHRIITKPAVCVSPAKPRPGQSG